MNAAQTFRSMSDEDKAALAELRGYMKEKTGVDVKLGDAIAAVTPGLETPEHLRNV